MTARSVALFGVDGSVVDLHVTLHTDRRVAHPSTSRATMHNPLREMTERVRAATRNSDLPWPDDPMTIELRPDLQPKTVVGCDLAMACAIQAAIGTLTESRLAETVVLGDLGLDGTVRSVRGVVPALLTARQAGIRRAIVPRPALPETGYVSGLTVYGVDHLSEVVPLLSDNQYPQEPAHDQTDRSGGDGGNNRGVVGSPVDSGLRSVPGMQYSPRTAELLVPRADANVPDLADVTGQPEARWALEVAAAGGHHLLYVGAPGTGKTMLAQRLPGILPPLTDEQILEVAAIHSIAGLPLASEPPLAITPPFIAPHHTSTVPALIGGGSGLAKPGAISTAHNGVLLLDEVCEFPADRLEALRTALVEGEVRLARRDGVARYPAKFQLVLATSPCPCAASSEQDCACSPHAKRKYMARLSGPLLDRVDLRVRLRPTTPRSSAHLAPEATAMVRERVTTARSKAAERWRKHGWPTNAHVPGPALRREFALPRTVTALLDRSLDIGAVTARGADRCLRVSWTLADLAEADRPTADHVAAALQFRDFRTT